MYSFDIFDTLITRTTATPRGIFSIIQKILQNAFEYKDIQEHVRDNFYHLRIAAEKLARASFCNTEVEDITLDQIYEAFASNGLVAKEQSDRIKTLEIQTEIKNIIKISSNVERVCKLVAAGEKVVLISDMYLDRDVIRRFLLPIDTAFKNIPIYVSSEYGKTKRSGNLYKLVAEKENFFGRKEWIHVGDNFESDVMQALAFGIKTEHYQYEPLLPYEELLLKKQESDAAIQLMIGAARNARLSYCNTRLGQADSIRKRGYTVGSSIGGAILYPYVMWVLEQCIANKIKRLYFVARDGYIMKEIADKLIQWNELELQTFYFYGSRKAWRMPSLSVDNFHLESILEWSYLNKVKSLEELSNLFDISKEEFAKYLPMHQNIADKQLTPKVLNKLLELLGNHEAFQKSLCNSQSKKRELVEAYIKQEIDLSEPDFAFVELSGTGLTQECLAKICQGITKLPIRTFFLKKDRVRRDEIGISYVYTYNNTPLAYMIELLCRAPHGQTIGYRRSKGKVVPILTEDEMQQLIEHGYDSYIEGVMVFCEMYHRATYHNCHMNKSAPILLFEEYMDYIMQTPDQETANYFGDMPFNLTGRDEEEVLFAPKLRQDQLQQIFLTRYNEPIDCYYKGSSLEYSLLRCSKEELELVSQYRARNQAIRWSKDCGIVSGMDIGWGSEHEYTDEYDLIAENIILYAAGKRGQLLYHQLKDRPEYNIIAWIDMEYEKYQAQDLKVQKPAVISTMEYDQIVIGVQDKKVADDIIINLLKLDVPRNKILWIQPKARQ